MLKKINILVPTAFSSASRAGIRFAIQWSRQQNVQLTLVHVLTLLRLTKWSDQKFDAFAAAERERNQEMLDVLIADVQHRYSLRPGTCSSLLIEGVSADLALIDYCRRHPEIDLVCMGTRGASKVDKLFGTNTGNFITHSDTPVIAVPAGYRMKKISRLLYATDLDHYESELKEIVTLARPLHARISVLHLTQPTEIILDANFIQKIWEKEFGYPVAVDFRPADTHLSFVMDLEKTIRTFRPSAVILFSNRRRTLFQSIFYPSRAERLAFRVKTPLLVVGKEQP